MEHCLTGERLPVVGGDDSARMIEAIELQSRRNRLDRLKLDKLRHALLCQITDAESLQRQNEYEKGPWLYVIRYFDQRLQDCSSLLAAVRPNSLPHLRSGDPEDPALGYKLLLETAKCINETKSDSLTLQDMAELMAGNELLSLDNSALNIRVVFHIVGWLTGVWDAEQSPDETVLRIKNGGRIPGQQMYYWFNQHAVQETERQVQEVHASQIHHIMAGAFGDLLPRPEQTERLRDLQTPQGDHRAIPKAYFSWQALSSVGYRISWTSTLKEHLQVDERHNVLSVYQHPSLCWLLYKRKGCNLLTKFFFEEQKQRAQQEGRAFDDRLSISYFFDDLLRSYRLIFAPGSILGLRSSRELSPNILPQDCDPVLRALCSGDEENAILVSLRADLEHSLAVEAHVNLDKFPFLGTRLGALSEIGNGRPNPRRLWKLWVEKWNPNGHTQYWVVIFLAFLTLLLQFTQTGVNIMQAVTGR